MMKRLRAWWRWQESVMLVLLALAVYTGHWAAVGGMVVGYIFGVLDS